MGGAGPSQMAPPPVATDALLKAVTNSLKRTDSPLNDLTLEDVLGSDFTQSPPV